MKLVSDNVRGAIREFGYAKLAKAVFDAKGLTVPESTDVLDFVQAATKHAAVRLEERRAIFDGVAALKRLGVGQ